MSKKSNSKSSYIKKKTSIGRSERTKTHSKGGGVRGSTTSKNYKKKYRGQGQVLVINMEESDRPYLQIPLAPPEWYQEMLEKERKKNEEDQLDQDDTVIIIEMQVVI